MIGKVEVRFMTEEERLAYIKKHPIRPTKRPKGSTFVTMDGKSKDRRDKAKKRWGYNHFTTK